MNKLLSVFIFLLASFLSGAQPIVFNNVTNQIDFPRNIFTKGSNYLICYGKNFADDFGVAEIDQHGNIVSNNFYGTPLGAEEVTFARRQANHEIIMMGLSFWDGVTNIGDYKGYAMIIDTNGNFKKAFSVKGTTTRVNRIHNALFVDNHYYFIGEELDSTMYMGPSKLFLCKTDTMGNMIWYKRYPQLNITVGQYMGFEITYDKKYFLLGMSTADSTIGTNAYHSYYMIRMDTAGNYINRISIPEFPGNIHYTGVNPIHQISQIFESHYFVGGNREHYLLDSNFNITYSFDLVNNIHPSWFSNKNYYDNSYLVGGGLGFSKIYQGNTLFTKDLSSEPQIIKITNVISTLDNGYIAIVLITGGYTRIIKMDCEGNYINPIYCWPTGTPEMVKIDLKMHYFNHQLSFQNKSERTLSAKLFDIQGRALKEYTIKPGITNFEIGNYASGIYFVNIVSEHTIIKSEKIWVE